MTNLKNRKGVDISSNNGKISIEKIKDAGYDFVMIRAEDIAEQDDTYWEGNVRKCEAAGLPWGAYFYSYACSEASARSELAHILRLLRGKKPLLPVAIDIEDADGYHQRHGGWNLKNIDRACRIFLEGVRDAGYYPMLYTGFEEVENYISEAVSQTYDMWFAHWARSCGYKGDNLCMWQYGGETNLIESNSIPGIGVIDKNLCYKDYPTIIMEGGFNGWSGEHTVTHGLTAAQAMSGARGLVGKDEDPDECDIMAWYGGFNTDIDINRVACCCAGMFYLFYKLDALDLIPGGKVADCGSLARNFYNAGQLHPPDEVRPGDLVIFSWSGNRTSVQPLRDLGYKSFELSSPSARTTAASSATISRPRRAAVPSFQPAAALHTQTAGKRAPRRLSPRRSTATEIFMRFSSGSTVISALIFTSTACTVLRRARLLSWRCRPFSTAITTLISRSTAYTAD